MSKASRQTQRIWLIIGFTVLGYFANQYEPEEDSTTTTRSPSIEALIERHQSDTQVTLRSVVFKILADDLTGSRHQRFLIKLGSGDTVLIAHNIDLAPKIDTLQKGDSVTISGEYEWNNKGGVIHWTHHDPAKRHVGGWIEHNGKRYQ